MSPGQIPSLRSRKGLSSAFVIKKFGVVQPGFEANVGGI